MAHTTEIGGLARTWLDGRMMRGEIVKGSRTVQASRLRSLERVHGDRPIHALDRATLLRWQVATGRHSPAARRAALSTVSGFAKWLVVEGHLAADPTATLVRIREPRRVPRALSAADVSRVLRSCPNARTSAMVWLMVGCGLRCVEVAGLDLHNWDPAASTVHVVGKGGHERVLPVPDAVAAALKAYAAHRGHRAGPLIVPDPQGKWSPSGRLSPARVSALVSKAMVDGGVHQVGDGRSAHALRHTAASDVLDACRDIRVVQEMLGHQSMATTQVYLRRADLGRMREAMEGRDYGPPPPAAA